MTSYDVDVDELVAVTAAMGSCGRALADLAADVERAQQVLHDEWAGLASEAHAASHGRWRESFAEMATALEGLRSLGDTAQATYTAAVEANLALWARVR